MFYQVVLPVGPGSGRSRNLTVPCRKGTLTPVPRARANGIEIEYETFGDPSAPALLLIMGLGAQLVTWPEELCHLLAGRGLRVIRFDNRDSGLSTKLDHAPPPDVLAAVAGDTSSASYTLDDMADDAAGLLDALGIDAAHLVGASMGGMIAQAFAIRHPHRTLSLCSMMSTTGHPCVGQPTPEAFALLSRPPALTRDEVVGASVASARVIGSSRFAIDEEVVRARAARAYDRAFHPAGVARQLCAIIASGDRTEALGRVTAPTLVVHGTADTLVTPSGGEATAEAVPGAVLLMIEGMGHDLPEETWPEIIEAIVANTVRVAA